MYYKLDFVKIGDNRYKTDIPTVMYEKVIEIVDKLSNGEMQEYGDDINKRFIDSILARLVSSSAFKQELDFGSTSFALIECYYGSDPVIVSVGKIPIDMDGTYCKACGVYYVD